jgi:hypothetical protein
MRRRRVHEIYRVNGELAPRPVSVRSEEAAAQQSAQTEMQLWTDRVEADDLPVKGENLTVTDC